MRQRINASVSSFKITSNWKATARIPSWQDLLPNVILPIASRNLHRLQNISNYSACAKANQIGNGCTRSSRGGIYLNGCAVSKNSTSTADFGQSYAAA